MISDLMTLLPPAASWEENSIMEWELYLVRGFWLLIAVLVIAGLVDRIRRKDWPAVKRYLSCLGIVLLVLFGAGMFFAYHLLKSFEYMKCGSTRFEMAAWSEALELYRNDVADSTYPSTLLQLYSDNAPGWAGPYLATVTTDPWDNAYTYQSDGSSFTITSVHVPAFTSWAETIPVVITRTSSDTTTWREFAD